MNFTISGQIKDENSNPLVGVFVEAHDSDIGSDDYLGLTKTDEHGKFQLTFSEKAFKDFLEGNPDVYLIIRNEFVVLHKTSTKSGTKNGTFFDVVIKSDEKFIDLYENSIQRTFAQFNSMGDTIDLSKIDSQRVFVQMIRGLSSWTYYSNPAIMHNYGYAGPQVPRYPKKEDHSHTLPWNKK